MISPQKFIGLWGALVVLIGGVDAAHAIPPANTPRIDLPSLSALAKIRSSPGNSEMVLQDVELAGHPELIALDFSSATNAYVGRSMSAENVAALRDAMTRIIIDTGYINSGARVPKQTADNGRLTINLVAGHLDRVHVVGARHFRSQYLEKRIQLNANDPLNIHDLEKRLQWLAAEPLIDRLRAKLEPGLNPGEAVLVLKIREHAPYRLNLFVGNDTVRSIGSEHMRLTAGHQNVLGNRDAFEAYLGQSEGLDEWKVNYSIPVNRFDTLISASYRVSSSRVIRSEVDLDAIRLESESRTLTLGIDQPFRFGRRTEVVIGLHGNLRRANSKVNGFGFFLSPGDDENGKVRATILRASQQVSTRSKNSVFSVRSTVSFGLDAFNASKGDIGRGADVPDGTFVSWLGQAYWVSRLPASLRRAQVIVRGDVQIAQDPLLGMERFAAGGHRTVRGYSENTLVRDNGYAASVEVRIPLAVNSRSPWTVELAPFVDGGRAWNRGRGRERDTLLSAGLGIRTRYKDQLKLSVEWGKRLLHQDGDADGLQGHGVHLQAEIGI